MVTRTHEAPTFIGNATANKNSRKKKCQSENVIENTRGGSRRATGIGSYFG